MERKTIIIIGVTVAVLIVTGAIVAIVLLLQKKDDDPDTTTPANSSSTNGGQNGSTGGGANEDSTASQDLETWNEDWTMEWDQKEASKYLFTQISNVDLGDNVDDAREMCLQYAHDINQDSPVCGISFYPLAYGTPEEKQSLGNPSTENTKHKDFPCNIFSDCTSNYPSVIKSIKGSQTLFTDTGLLCERGVDQPTNGDWRDTILNDDISRNILNSIYLNKSISDDDDNAVIKISRETLLPNATKKKISKIRGDCLTRASEMDNVCGVNFYPRAFVTTTGDKFHNGIKANDALTGIQGNDGWDETTYQTNSNNFLSEENYDNPCQIFVDCDSNPGYELGTAEGEGAEALFSRPFIRCMNNNGGHFFDD